MTEQPLLLDWTPRFHGETYLAERDYDRLCAQAKRVLAAVSDGLWHTLHSLSQITGDPEASVSARLRTLRSEGFTVERRHVKNGLWEYRVRRAGE